MKIRGRKKGTKTGVNEVKLLKFIKKTDPNTYNAIVKLPAKDNKGDR